MIAINSSLLEHVLHFQYLGSDIPYKEDKINKFQRTCGTVIRTLKNNTLRDMQLKFYKVMAVSTLCIIHNRGHLGKEILDRDKFFKSVEGVLRETQYEMQPLGKNQTFSRLQYIVPIFSKRVGLISWSEKRCDSNSADDQLAEVEND